MGELLEQAVDVRFDRGDELGRDQVPDRVNHFLQRLGRVVGQPQPRQRLRYRLLYGGVQVDGADAVGERADLRPQRVRQGDGGCDLLNGLRDAVQRLDNRLAHLRDVEILQRRLDLPDRAGEGLDGLRRLRKRRLCLARHRLHARLDGRQSIDDLLQR